MSLPVNSCPGSLRSGRMGIRVPDSECAQDGECGGRAAVPQEGICPRGDAEGITEFAKEWRRSEEEQVVCGVERIHHFYQNGWEKGSGCLAVNWRH